MALHYQYRVNLLTPSNRTDSQRLTVERPGLPTLDIPLAAGDTQAEFTAGPVGTAVTLSLTYATASGLVSSAYSEGFTVSTAPPPETPPDAPTGFASIVQIGSVDVPDTPPPLPPVAGFLGNPYQPITAIDTTGGIALSRVSGTTPMFIQVSGSNILATGTSRPYEDLEYSWDFGDPSGAETLVNPVTGLTENLNDSQRGPEAAYCYRNPGTYTITLTVRGVDGSGAFVTATTTTAVTVSQYTAAAHYWFDSINGSDSNDGLTQATPRATFRADPGNSEIQQQERVHYHFARGGTYSFNIVFQSRTRVSAFGSGAKPILRASGSNGLAISIGSPDQTVENIVISDCILRQVGRSRTLFCNVSSTTNTAIRDLYLDNVDFDAMTGLTANFVAIQMTQRQWNFGLWKCSFDAGTNITSGEYLGAATGEWRFIVGCIFANGVGDAAAATRATGHNIYTGNENHQLIAYCRLGHGDPLDRLFCINGNTSSPPGTFARQWSIHSNTMRNFWGAVDLSNTDNSRSLRGVLDDIVLQRNDIRDMGNLSSPTPAFRNGTYVNWSYASDDATWRQNTIIGIPGASGLWAWPDTLARPQIYDNTVSSTPELPSGGGGSRNNNTIAG